MLYIDPDACIDCGACMEECPVDAIYYEEDLPPELTRFKDINAAYFARHPLTPDTSPSPVAVRSVQPGTLRVAIVGAGPAACYAAMQLLSIDGVEVTIFERLPTPFGLIRGGVAPDHQRTKAIANVFADAFKSDRLRCYFGVEIGTQLTHTDLMDHHDAVIYATGAPHSPLLGIPGEQLPGVYAASDFVGWYNGHPDHGGHSFDLNTERVVIVGNGNVALDSARMLVSPRNVLASTDIADHALHQLSRSAIEEVVILGRRGLVDSAFSAAEFHALGHLDGVDVVIDHSDLPEVRHDDIETQWKIELAHEYAQRRHDDNNKRIVFRFNTVPVRIEGADRVELLQVKRRGGTHHDEPHKIAGRDSSGSLEEIPTHLVLRSIGYRGQEIPGVPFDSETGTVPTLAGRVLDADDRTLPGVYATGWIKRGARGVIGTNRTCAEETVSNLLADFTAGTLSTRAVATGDALQALMRDRCVEHLGWDGWAAIDAAERQRGADAGRPRAKYVSIEEMWGIATASR